MRITIRARTPTRVHFERPDICMHSDLSSIIWRLANRGESIYGFRGYKFKNIGPIKLKEYW
jgi:hypothetical protein